MHPILPDRPHHNGEFIVITGAGIDPLPVSIDPSGLVMCEWEFSAEDLAHAVNGGRVRVWIVTGGNPWQPVLLEVMPAADDGSP